MLYFPKPTPEDQYNFVLRLYFGSEPNPLQCCIARAYLDMNRTLHGLATLPSALELRHQANQEIQGSLTNLPRFLPKGSSQSEFDDWHRSLCHHLKDIYRQNDFPMFSIGQAQKWVNMTMKYVYVFGEEQIPGYSHLYSSCHIPLDNIIRDRLKKWGAPRLSKSWSRLDSYNEYINFQYWIRDKFIGSSPLSVEFHLWQEPE